MKVRCPKCHRAPDHIWACNECHARFNTFQTRARCPRCSKTFLDTQCGHCAQRSLHEDFYGDGLLSLEFTAKKREVSH